MNMKLKKDILEPNRYQYLDQKDSDIYDSIRSSRKHKDLTVKRLIREKAEASFIDHCNSIY